MFCIQVCCIHSAGTLTLIGVLTRPVWTIRPEWATLGVLLLKDRLHRVVTTPYNVFG